MAAKKLSSRIVTDEIKAIGILNSEQLQEGIIIVEGEDGKEIQLHDYLSGFDGTSVEISIKKKIEEVL